MSIFARIRQSLHRLVFGRPVAVLVATAVLTSIALGLGTRVELRTSRTELAPEGDPEQARLNELVARFNGSQALVVAVESRGAGDAQALRSAVDLLAAELRERPEIESVFHRVDVDWLLQHALHLAPPDVVRRMAEALRISRSTLESEDVGLDLAGLARVLSARIEEGLQAGDAGDLEEIDPGALATLLRGVRTFLEDPLGSIADVPVEPPLRALARARGQDPGDGALSTRDGRTHFLFVVPADPEDSLNAHRALTRVVREVAGAVVPGRTISLAGNPATTVEEMDSIAGDTWRTAGVAAVGVALLTLLVFRWRFHAALVLAALAVGVILSYGAVFLELGYLNMVTSAFLSTLIGVGVAYGIHPVSEYELEGAHTIDPDRAVERAFRRTGPAVATAAVTTAVAFFAILFMRFRAFAELGLVAGVGVLLCLAAALISLPAMLLLHGRWRAGRPGGPRGDSAIDRLWLGRGAAAVTRFPRAVTLVALLTTVAAAFAAPGIRFDINLLELLPADAESVRTQRKMLFESDVSPLFNLVVTDDLGELRDLEERAREEPTVRDFQSLLLFLPENPGESRQAVAALAREIDRAPWPSEAPTIDPVPLAASLERLRTAILEAADEAFVAGLGDLAAGLEDARVETETLLELVETADSADVEGWNRALESLWPWLDRLVEDLRTASRVESPSVDSLPPELRHRFLTRDGRFLGYLQPSGEVFDEPFLEEFVAASRRISPSSTGFPIVFLQMAQRITSGFYRALGVGALLVVLTLLIDTRSLRRTAWAVLPLTLGIVWMLGAMRLLGLSFNFANLVAVPLIVGVGIDNGVHIVHRLSLEGAEGISVVLRHTGRAILIASSTTMVGFGSLALASHRGLASLGLVLLLGVGACLLTSMVVLPNLLVAFGVVRK